MGCGCGNQQAVIKYRLTRTDGTHTDFDTLDEAREINKAELNNTGTIRTARVVLAKQ